MTPAASLTDSLVLLLCYPSSAVSRGKTLPHVRHSWRDYPRGISVRKRIIDVTGINFVFLALRLPSRASSVVTLSRRGDAISSIHFSRASATFARTLECTKMQSYNDGVCVGAYFCCEYSGLSYNDSLLSPYVIFTAKIYGNQSRSLSFPAERWSVRYVGGVYGAITACTIYRAQIRIDVTGVAFFPFLLALSSWLNGHGSGCPHLYLTTGCSKNGAGPNFNAKWNAGINCYDVFIFKISIIYR